ncbi:MAG: MauE/DoxX family redox-associated membrane protein [Acidimicrobiales bacterium]
MALSAGGLYAVALLLGGAGIAKVARPVAVTRALAAAKLPGWHQVRGLPIGQLVGMAEIVAAAIALAFGNRSTAGIVAAFYVVFAAVAWRMLVVATHREPCGCFGETRTPISPIHVVVDLIAAAAAAFAVVSPPGSILDVRHEAWSGVPLLFATAMLTWLFYVALTTVPAALEVRTQRAQRDQPSQRPPEERAGT